MKKRDNTLTFTSHRTSTFRPHFLEVSNQEGQEGHIEGTTRVVPFSYVRTT